MRNSLQDSIEEIDYEEVKKIDVEEIGIKKYPSVSEDDSKEKSVSESLEYDANTSNPKIIKLDKTKQQKVKSQLSLPQKDSGVRVHDIIRSRRKSSIIPFDQKAGADPTSELNYICKLILNHQALTSLIRDRSSKFKANQVSSIPSCVALAKSEQEIETPRINYDMLDK